MNKIDQIFEELEKLGWGDKKDRLEGGMILKKVFYGVPDENLEMNPHAKFTSYVEVDGGGRWIEFYSGWNVAQDWDARNGSAEEIAVYIDGWIANFHLVK